MLYRILFFVVLSLASAGAAFASGIEVDVAGTSDYLPPELEAIRQHFIKANPVEVTLKNLDKDVPKSEKFLKAVADDAVRITPRGKIILETANKAVVDAFNKQLSRSQYYKDITVKHVLPAGCVPPLLPAVSVASVLKANGNSFSGFEKYLVSQLTTMTTVFESGARQAWEYLEASNTVPGKKEQSFKILIVEGRVASGKTHLLNALSAYLGNHDMGKALASATSLGSGLQRLALVPQGQVALVKLNHTQAANPVNTIGTTQTHSAANLPSVTASNISDQNKKILEAAFKLHDGSFPLVLMIDEMDKMDPHSAYLLELTELIHGHIANLKGKEDSFKVIFASNPYSPGAHLLNLGDDLFWAEYLDTWSSESGGQVPNPLGGVSPLPPIFISPIGVKL